MRQTFPLYLSSAEDTQKITAKGSQKKFFFLSLSPHALGDSRSALTFPVFLKGYGLNADA